MRARSGPDAAGLGTCSVRSMHEGDTVWRAPKLGLLLCGLGLHAFRMTRSERWADPTASHYYFRCVRCGALRARA